MKIKNKNNSKKNRYQIGKNKNKEDGYKSQKNKNGQLHHLKFKIK